VIHVPLKSPPKIGGPGSTAAINTTWTTVSIPTLPDGSYPRFVMLTIDSYQYVGLRHLGPGMGFTRGIGLQPDNWPYIFDVHGQTQVMLYRTLAATPTDVHLTPLANQ
jgi:hypothetical protein